MPTAEQIAAGKAAQEQEGFSRTPITDGGERVTDPHQEPLNDATGLPDPSTPSGDDGADGAQPQRQGRPKPVYMSPSDEARANIAKRFRRDEEGKVPYNGDPNDPEMLYGKFGRPEEDPPQAGNDPDPALEPQRPQQQPQEKLFTIKVRGKEMQLTEAQLLERASKVEAADSYLEEGRSLLEQARQVRRDNRERDPADPHRPEDRNNAQDDGANIDPSNDPQHPGDDLEAAIDEVRYGVDSKEAAQKLRKVIGSEADKAADQRQIQRLVGQDNTKSTTAMKAFIEANPDIAKDEIASSIMAQQIYAIQREELVKVGIDEAKLPKDQKTLAQWHQFQRIHGSPVSSQEKMLEAAKGRLDSWRGTSRQQQPEQRGNKAPPRLEVNVDRNTRRAQLPNQPTRTMAPPQQRPQNQPAGPRDRSSIVADMRKSRGQVIG